MVVKCWQQSWEGKKLDLEQEKDDTEFDEKGVAIVGSVVQKNENKNQ